MFRGCLRAFHNNYNCINHKGVIYRQNPFGDILGTYHIETTQQICNAKVLTGFYITRIPTKDASAQALVKEF